MIRLIIFDLDGVLADTKMAHFNALNQALEENGQPPIPFSEHIHRFDGLPTEDKLDILLPLYEISQFGFEQRIHLNSLYRERNILRRSIARRKQELTELALEEVALAPDGNDLLRKLIDNKIQIACVSNAKRETTEAILWKFPALVKPRNDWRDEPEYYLDVGIYTPYTSPYFYEAKPNCQMYLLAIANYRVSPKETLIIEDSPKGLTAAYESGAHVLPVKDINDLTIDKVFHRIDILNEQAKPVVTFEAPDLNILIPMAGAGKRFEQEGYTFPKPLIEVHGKPMVQLVTENLGLKGHFIYIVQREHYDRYNLNSLLHLISPDCDIVCIDGVTEGAACTALKAREHIKEDKPLLIANSDQYIEYDPMGFLYKARNYDGAILTFKATHPKWSFVRVEDGYVKEVAEKNPISDIATAGVYYWNSGCDFVDCVEDMTRKNIRTNNEFYIAPAFNELINTYQGKVISYEIEQMWGLGTPEDLRYFLESHANGI